MAPPPIPRRSILRALLALALVWPARAAGQEAGAPVPEPLALQRIEGMVELDGMVDEAAWGALTPLPATMHVPTFGAEPTERTEFRVGYDDEYLYFSCRAFDSDPDGIQAPSLRRDDGSFANDWCAIGLDTFNDKETALVFGTNPVGVRTEAVFPGDGAGQPNFSWNTFWDAAVARTTGGWSAEVRIPFSSLRFQAGAGDGSVRMGLLIWRLIARKNELISFPAVPPRWGFVSPFKASQFREVVLDGPVPSRPLYVTPYALGGLGRTHALNGAGTGYDPLNERVGDVGLDLKYGLASNLTLDVTVNTDFAQVEADDQQVNLTRFSLFFPEKRLFFQERSSTFDYSLGGSERLFHSRRIGLVNGEQVPIYGGARIVGRVGPWDVGFLDMQTAETALSPSENLGVLRLRRRVLNENSTVGGIVTTRFAESGAGFNVVYGLDALVRVFGQDYLTLNWAQSFDDQEEAVVGPIGVTDRGLARVAWQRRGQDGLTYRLDVGRFGQAFEPGLGFLLRRDFTRVAASAGYGWRPGESSPLLEHTLSAPATVFTRNEDGTVETVEVSPQYQVQLKSGHTWTGRLAWTYEDLRSGFELGDGAAVPAGEHRFATVRLSYGPPDGRLMRVSGAVEGGQFYDGRLLSASVSPGWNVSKHLELGGTYRVDDLRFEDRGQAFTAHVARLRAQVMATTRLSGAAFVQFSSAADAVSANLRVRYNPSEGHDLYLVWNEGLNTDRYGAAVVRPLSDRRTLLIKYSRTLTLGL